MRSHPPTLIRLVETVLRRLELQGSRLLVAVSGGPDSMALLHVLGRLGERLKLQVFAHGVDHGLRAEASAELDLAGGLAAQLGVPFTRSKLQLAAGGNLQARARAARYEQLEARAAELGAWLCTAHHADDRAETVLLRLLRGSGPDGLAVLPERAGLRVRPMLRATRADVELHLRRHHVAVAEDPSNQDPRFLRVRVRHELLPLLRELSPGIVGHLTALADQLAPSDPLAPSEPQAAPPRDLGAALNRAQIQALQQALARGEGVELKLKHSRILRLSAGPVQHLEVQPVATPGGKPE